MNNYWLKTVGKEEFISEITERQEFSPEELEALNEDVDEEVHYYISFEEDRLRCYTRYNSESAAFTSDLELASSSHDEERNITEHLFIGYDPETHEELGRVTFVEDFDNDRLLSDEQTVEGFRFASVAVEFEVDAGNGWKLKLCCASCYLVHDALDIHFIDCLCCLGRCGFRCGPQI